MKLFKQMLSCIMILVLVLTGTAFAQETENAPEFYAEIEEIDLYDPSVYVEESEEAELPEADEESALEAAEAVATDISLTLPEDGEKDEVENIIIQAMLANAELTPKAGCTHDYMYLEYLDENGEEVEFKYKADGKTRHKCYAYVYETALYCWECSSYVSRSVVKQNIEYYEGHYFWGDGGMHKCSLCKYKKYTCKHKNAESNNGVDKIYTYFDAEQHQYTEITTTGSIFYTCPDCGCWGEMWNGKITWGVTDNWNEEIDEKYVSRLENHTYVDGVCTLCEGIKPITSITLSDAKLELGLKQTHTLKASFAPADCKDTITFTSSKSSVASVGKTSGKITAKKTGTAVITAKAASGATATCTVKVYKAPSSIKAVPTKMTLGVGEEADLGYKITGKSRTKVKFTSSNAAVTVDENGHLTANEVGKAKITLKTHNGKKAYCTVTVKNAPAGIALDQSSLTLGQEETYALKATLTENSAGKITYTSSNPAAVTVDEKGVITAKIVGSSATITAETFNGKSATCAVSVVKAPTTLDLNMPDAPFTLIAKQKFTMVPTVDAGSHTTLTFNSSRKSVATISAEGVITAKKAGTTTISVTTHNDITRKISLKVYKAPSSLKLNASSKSLRLGKTFTIKPTITKGSRTVFTYTVSGDAVTVDQNGVVTTNKVGSATITVKTHNGLKKTCKIKVLEPFAGPIYAGTELSGYMGTNAGAFMKKFGGFKKTSAGSDMTTYKNTYLTVNKYSYDDNIASIWINKESPYTIQGIYAGMSMEEASAKLLEKGFEEKFRIGNTSITYYNKSKWQTVTIRSRNSKGKYTGYVTSVSIGA